MIRHYETSGLIPRARRSASNYRLYDEHDVHTLRFIRQSRKLGFSLSDIEQLLALWRDRNRPSSKVKQLVLAHTRELDARILELQEMKRSLETLAEHCHGDDRPECPILNGLENTCDVSATPTTDRVRANAKRRRTAITRR